MSTKSSYRRWNREADTILSLKYSFGRGVELEKCLPLQSQTLILRKTESVLAKPITGQKEKMLLLTEQSVRVIDIPQFLTQEIKDYVDKLYELPDDERIFPIVAEAVQHKLKHNCEKTGVKKIRVHDIRHSHVAYLINQGVQPLIIKERLGHRDIKITLNTYGHLYPNQQRQVADMLNQQRTEKVPTAATVRT